MSINQIIIPNYNLPKMPQLHCNEIISKVDGLTILKLLKTNKAANQFIREPNMNVNGHILDISYEIDLSTWNDNSPNNERNIIIYKLKRPAIYQNLCRSYEMDGQKALNFLEDISLFKSSTIVLKTGSPNFANDLNLLREKLARRTLNCETLELYGHFFKAEVASLFKFNKLQAEICNVMDFNEIATIKTANPNISIVIWERLGPSILLNYPSEVNDMNLHRLTFAGDSYSADSICLILSGVLDNPLQRNYQELIFERCFTAQVVVQESKKHGLKYDDLLINWAMKFPSFTAINRTRFSININVSGDPYCLHVFVMMISGYILFCVNKKTLNLFVKLFPSKNALFNYLVENISTPNCLKAYEKKFMTKSFIFSMDIVKTSCELIAYANVMANASISLPNKK